MPRLRPFDGYVVNPARALDVIAPAYDSLSPEDRARFSGSHPDNYLNVMRTREDYPGEDIGTSEILARNKRNLERLVKEGAFVPFKTPSLFVYRLSHGDHRQSGLVAELPVSEIDNGSVLKHEQTRRDREDLLVEYQQVVGASSSPVALAYRSDARIDDLMHDVQRRSTPILDTLAEDGVRQELWRVVDPSMIDAFVTLFASVPVAYLTDGHHRTAAASRYVERVERGGRRPASDNGWNHVLVALFPHDELRVLPFNRVVRDLGTLDREGFLRRLSEAFEVVAIEADPSDPPLPKRQGTFIMVLDESCYRLHARCGAVDPDDPSASLDVSLLQRHILEPILGISDSTSDDRLEYVSGTAGRDGVNHLRGQGWRLAFYCHPATVAEIMAVSDAGQIMPPKSTCFEPKVRSGLFLRLVDPIG